MFGPKNAVQKLQVAYLHAHATVSAQDLLYKGTSAQQAMFGIYNLRSDIVNVISFQFCCFSLPKTGTVSRAPCRASVETGDGIFPDAPLCDVQFQSYLMPLRA